MKNQYTGHYIVIQQTQILALAVSSYNRHALLHNFDGQVLWPQRLVNSITSCTNIVLELHDVVLELRNRLYLDECGTNRLGSPAFKEGRPKEDCGVVLAKHIHHRRERILHFVVVTEDGAAMAGPELVPNILIVGAARADQPLGIVVERDLEWSQTLEKGTTRYRG
jgi:hypothetical protein